MTEVERSSARENRGGLDEMVARLRERAARGERTLAAIDGRCAAGKTTLAQTLGGRYGWSVIHMDHFFLRPEQRTPQRLSVPGENVDHERFLEQVLLPLKAGKSFCYRPFDCHTLAFGEPIRVEPGPVTLIEGSYSCNRALWAYYDLRAFLTVTPQLQRRRIRERNGEEGLNVFLEKWIPLEEAYFARAELERRCDYLLEL